MHEDAALVQVIYVEGSAIGFSFLVDAEALKNTNLKYHNFCSY